MAIIQDSLFDSFSVDMDQTKSILNKLRAPKKVKEVSVEDQIKSKNLSFDEKLRLVTEEVNRVLGRYKEDTICIYRYEELVKYIDKAIENGIISVDTETIATRDDIEKPATDPYTVKIAGPCMYTPGMKNSYIPVNHVDHKTGERLPDQLTEEQIRTQLERLVNKKVKVIYHNSKFDYKVIYYTCGVRLPIYWDTMIAAQILNENEKAGLKFQYRDKIDPEQGKYSIESLFQVDMFPNYPPELFALYAATDAYMTYKLYEYQKAEFEKAGNERLYSLFFDTEMPDTTNISEMEMWGMAIDREFAERLSRKLHTKLDKVNESLSRILSKYNNLVAEWRKTPQANFHPMKGKKQQHSMNEQLSDPIEVTSPQQLGIFLYDILKVLKTNDPDDKPVDEATLLSIRDKQPELVDLILEKREYEKMLGTYIDALPKLASPLDGRIHAKINQLGREDKNVVTGRMSSSDPNLQNIPARGDIVSIRCMFVPSTFYPEISSDTDTFEVPIENEVLMSDGSYRWSSEVKPGDVVEGDRIIKDVCVNQDKRLVYIKV